MKITTLGLMIAGFSLLPATQAGPITFNYSGTATGTLAGVAITDAFTLTALGDTANIGIFPGSVNTLDISPVTASFTWGAASGTITGALDWFNNPDGVTGLNLGFGSDRLDFEGDAATSSWTMLTSIGPIVQAGTGSSNGTIATSAGGLVLSSISSYTFQATVAESSAPEPSTGLSLLAGGALLLGLRYARRF